MDYNFQLSISYVMWIKKLDQNADKSRSRPLWRFNNEINKLGTRRTGHAVFTEWQEESVKNNKKQQVHTLREGLRRIQNASELIQGKEQLWKRADMQTERSWIINIKEAHPDTMKLQAKWKSTRRKRTKFKCTKNKTPEKVWKLNKEWYNMASPF